MLPTSCVLGLAASSSDRLGFWKDVYGFDMANLALDLVQEACVEVVPPSTLLSEPALFRTIDCTATTDVALDFAAPFALTATAAGQLRCWVLHFDTVFDCAAAGGVRTAFTTAASATPTHWKQTTLHLKEPVPLAAGDELSGTVRFSRCKDYKRGYDISVEFAHNGAHKALQMWKLE